MPLWGQLGDIWIHGDAKKKKVEKSRGSPYVFKVEVGKLVYLELGEIS